MNNYFTHFDEIFKAFDAGVPWDSSDVERERNTQTCTMPSFPHSNVWLSPDTNELSMEFALAGYSKDEISVTADIGAISVSVNPDISVCEGHSIHHGISRRQANFSVRIDKAFDARKATVGFEDGMLRIQMKKSKDTQAVQLM
jgi:HSP20 family molecular chaperone IbpA